MASTTDIEVDEEPHSFRIADPATSGNITYSPNNP